MKDLIYLTALLTTIVLLNTGCETITEPNSDVTSDISASQVERANAKDKVDICHQTSSEANPWILISVSEASVDKHKTNHGDLDPGEEIDDDYMLDELCEVVAIPDNGEGDNDDNTVGQIGDDNTDDEVDIDF